MAAYQQNGLYHQKFKCISSIYKQLAHIINEGKKSKTKTRAIGACQWNRFFLHFMAIQSIISFWNEIHCFFSEQFPICYHLRVYL